MKERMEELKNKIMPDGKAMILAYDQGFEHGPKREIYRNSVTRRACRKIRR